jgi:D-alanyl-D-alanine carboxypeptidase/D-alanyl-D-alanine-endopeptidase (penicillin-binding protein 4)
MMRIYFLIVIIFVSAPGIFPQLNKDQLKDKIEEILKDEFFNSASIAVEAFDLTTGEYLYRQNEKKLLIPASNMKIITDAAGLVFLGPRYNFITSLQYTGEITNKTLSGDLYIVGGFDPDFTTPDLDKFIGDLKKAGVTSISGNLYADVSKKDSAFWGHGWMWDDDPSTDAPYLSALNINSNCIDVFVTGTNPGEKAVVTTSPETNYIKIVNNTVISTVDKQDIYITRDWRNRKNDIYVSGYMLPAPFTEDDTVENSVNIYKPELYFITLFKERLEKNGIQFKGQLGLQKRPAAAKWLSVFSRQYDSVAYYMNKRSDNLSAEMILYSLAASFNTYPVTAGQGLKVVDSLFTLCGINKGDYVLADGSGVSRYNLLTAEQIVSVLKFMYSNNPELFKPFYDSLPIAGVDGTLSKRMNDMNAQGRVHAKTGTLRGVSCLSGYVNTKNNHLIAFSILEQNFVNQTSYARYIQDQICELLSDYD